MTFRLLSCDGGGIRGYLSSSLIRALDKATSGKFLSHIDGYAGTSTGSLISIALAAGVKIDQIVDLYAKKAADIFTLNPHWCILTGATEEEETTTEPPEGMLGSPGIIGSRYLADGLRAALTPYLGNTTFGDVTGKMLVVNSAQLNTTTSSVWGPATFNNKGVGQDYSRTQLIDAALASSAAPAYFPLHKIADLGWFADGGTFANNPVLNAIEVALASGLAGSLGEIEVLSFGTGLAPQGVPDKAIGHPYCWGATYWMRPVERKGVPAMALLNLTLDLASQNLEGIASRILPKANLVRINPALPGPVELDSYTPADYAIMDKAIAAAQQSAEWNAAIKMVESW